MILRQEKCKLFVSSRKSNKVTKDKDDRLLNILHILQSGIVKISESDQIDITQENEISRPILIFGETRLKRFLLF